jgi:hypothetical protein
VDENVLAHQEHSEGEVRQGVTRESVQVTMTPETHFAGSLDPILTRDRLASGPRVDSLLDVTETDMTHLQSANINQVASRAQSSRNSPEPPRPTNKDIMWARLQASRSS